MKACLDPFKLSLKHLEDNITVFSYELDDAFYQALEQNDIVGEAASVDVTRIEDIILWYGSRYQVNLGDNGNMEKKIASMYAAILSLSNYQTGRLDCSFTTWTDQVGFTPNE